MSIKIDDSTLYASRFSDVCSKCTHLKLNPSAKVPTCSAFPARIPAEIWNGQDDHTKPYPGDRGIQFKPRT